MTKRKSILRWVLNGGISFGFAGPAFTSFEDLWVSKNGEIQPCIQPLGSRRPKPSANSVCLAQIAKSAGNVIQHRPRTSMVRKAREQQSKRLWVGMSELAESYRYPYIFSHVLASRGTRISNYEPEWRKVAIGEGATHGIKDSVD